MSPITDASPPRKRTLAALAITIAVIAAVVLWSAGTAKSAQERIVESPWSNYTVQHNDWKKGSHQRRWMNLYNSGDSANPGHDSLNPDPFLTGPDPDFCISCTWPEGSPTYHGTNGE
jgi:hypothetical protein